MASRILGTTDFHSLKQKTEDIMASTDFTKEKAKKIGKLIFFISNLFF